MARPDPLDYFVMSLDRFFKELGFHKTSIGDVYREIQDIKKTLKRIENYVKPGVAQGVQFYCKINGRKTRVVEMFMKKDDVLDISVAFTDKNDDAAKVDGIPAWVLSDESLGSLEVAADGMSAAFTPAKIGVGTVQLKADSDLGEGVKEIIGELPIEVSALDAEKVILSAAIRAK